MANNGRALPENEKSLIIKQHTEIKKSLKKASEQENLQANDLNHLQAGLDDENTKVMNKIKEATTTSVLPGQELPSIDDMMDKGDKMESEMPEYSHTLDSNGNIIDTNGDMISKKTIFSSSYTLNDKQELVDKDGNKVRKETFQSLSKREKENMKKENQKIKAPIKEDKAQKVEENKAKEVEKKKEKKVEETKPK